MALCELLASRLDQTAALLMPVRTEELQVAIQIPGKVLLTSSCFFIMGSNFMHLHEVLCRYYGMHLVEYAERFKSQVIQPKVKFLLHFRKNGLNSPGQPYTCR